MKTLLAIILFFTTSNAFTQTTTAEEYEFVINGYKAQLDNRQPMRRGYLLLDMGNYNLLWNNGTNVRGIDFKALYRDNDKKPCAIMAIYYRNENGSNQFKEYFCLPTGSDNPLWEKLITQINNSWNTAYVKEMYSAMVFASMKMLAQQISR